MKSIHNIVLILLVASLVSTVSADLVTDTRSEWSLPSDYQDRHIKKVAFSQELYGISWAHWVVAVTGYDELASHIQNGDYDEVGLAVSGKASAAALSEMVPLADALPNLAQVVITLSEMSLNGFRFSLELAAMRIQHDRYFAARPFNSYTTILNLEPFDLLDGVNMTKEGRGWLFTSSGYLSPLPTGNYLSPAEFYSMAEHAWFTANIDNTARTAENQLLCRMFTARLAAELAGESLQTDSATNTSASLRWNCAPNTLFYVEHSTDLVNWDRSGPYSSQTNQVSAVISGLPNRASRYFRIACEGEVNTP